MIKIIKLYIKYNNGHLLWSTNKEKIQYQRIHIKMILCLKIHIKMTLSQRTHFKTKIKIKLVIAIYKINWLIEIEVIVIIKIL